MRKNIYTFLAMIAMGTPVAGAEVLLEENFDYPQGEFPLEESGWYTQWGGASSLSIGEGLTFEGYAGSGVGNGVMIDADDSNNPHRAFKQVTEGNVYVAFMLRPSTAYKKGYFLTLRDEKVNDYYSFNFNGRVSVNESGQLGLTFANNQNAVYADEVLDGNTTYLVVLKYTIVEGKNNDNVSLYCFDKMPDAEPATPLVGPLSDAAKVDNPAEEVYYLGNNAVAALRAEVELYRGNYGDAISYGLPLLADAESRWTQTDYDNLWSDSNSNERLFAPYIFDTFYTDLCYDTTNGDYYILNDDIVFDEGDIREAWTVYPFTMSASSSNPREVRSFGKYNRMYYENTDVRYINTIRYSGVCFIVAEAYARDNKEAEAIALMNRYLAARGVDEWDAADPDLTGDGLIEAIIAEKRKEFVGEGTRWFDLKRLGGDLDRYSNFGSSVSSTVKEGDYRWLFPIPRSEYRYNEYVNQNPDWPVIAVE